MKRCETDWSVDFRNMQIVVTSQPEVLQSCGKEPAVAMKTSLCYASELQSALNPIPYCWQVHWKQQNNTSKTGSHPLLLLLWWKSHGQAVQRQPQVDFLECKEQTSYIIIRPWRFVSCWARTSLRKVKKRKNIESEEKERGKVKKSNDCFHSFFFIALFGAPKHQKDCLMEDVYFCSNVFKIPRRWYITYL